VGDERRRLSDVGGRDRDDGTIAPRRSITPSIRPGARGSGVTVCERTISRICCTSIP
jgi:hypothetical protein